MNEELLVTICIPNYNNEKTISKTLDSLLSQTYKNIKIKVFDNDSSDSSVQIIQEYERKNKNIELYINEKNIGGEANFTKCIQHLEGEYGAVFHADDIYLETMVAKQVEFLQADSFNVAVATHGYVIDDNEQVVGMRPIPQKYMNFKEYVFTSQVEFLQSILRYGNFITCPSVMARTSVYVNKIQSWNGGDFKTSADLDVWLRLSEYGKFGIITAPLIKYRESTVSYSYKDTRTRVGENNMFLVLNHYCDLYRDSHHLTKNDLARYEFLLFKDNVNRTINLIINNNTQKLSIHLLSINILRTSIESKENMKIYLIGVIVKMLRNIKLSKFIREKIYSYRFKRGNS